MMSNKKKLVISLVLSFLIIEFSCAYHDADTNKNWIIEKSELDRVTSFYNAGQYHCN